MRVDCVNQTGFTSLYKGGSLVSRRIEEIQESYEFYCC